MKESKKIKDTTRIIGFDDDTVKISENFYTEESINKTIGKINNQIEAYRSIYKRKPILILISKELEVLLRIQMDLMNQCEMVVLNGEPLELYRVFGFSCIPTPTLKDLEFAVV